MKREKLSEYWKRFPDGSPSRWKVQENENGWLLGFPNGAELLVRQSSPKIGFGDSLEKDNDTTTLWRNSLRYLTDFANAEEYTLVSEILQEFEEYLQKCVLDKDRFTGSLDHQCALQLRAICELRSWIEIKASMSVEGRGGYCPSDQLTSQLERLCRSLCKVVRKYDLLKPNNHGVMLAISIIHALHMFEDLEMGFKYSGVQKFLLNTFKSVITDDGVVNENTPGYQAFYIKLLTEIIEFQTWGDGSANKSFIELRSIITKAYRKMLLPSGAVPPLGDSSISPQSNYEAEIGTWISEPNGIFVSSTLDSYLSLIAGCRGVFHKHLDDTSIFLWYKGDTLLNDAGLLSYDKLDPIAVSIRGQLGHSGLFFRDFDHYRAEQVISYRSSTRTLDAKLKRLKTSGEQLFQVEAHAAFKGTRVRRVITSAGRNRFLIRDSVKGTAEANDAVSRFLFSENSRVQMVSDTCILVKTGNSWLSLASNVPFHVIEYYKGCKQGGETAKGFYAPKNYVATEAPMVEIPVSMNAAYEGKRLFYVSYGSVADGVDCWLG